MRFNSINDGPKENQKAIGQGLEPRSVLYQSQRLLNTEMFCDALVYSTLKIEVPSINMDRHFSPISCDSW